MIGTLLGNRYELLEKIGEGGMACVYKAKCHLLNRYVSVKILKAEYTKDEEFVDKFKKEATAAASLSDNNIVNIYDVGTQDEINYIVMEYVNGKTLKEIIRQQGVLNYNTALYFAIQIAKALDCAHKHNIIHRDIKPHNILVTEDGIVKVTDFGIAKASNSMTITNTNKVLGSAHYFSPEQAKGSFLDFRTDIYSFGIVLYEMVTGRVPYDAESPVSVALKHIQEAVIPPKQLNPDIPTNLNNLILKAIEKEPIKRYQNMKEMLIDIENVKSNNNYEIVKSKLDNENTRVMEPIVLDDNDEEEEEYDKPMSKRKKIALGVSIIVLLIIVAISSGILLPKILYPKANTTLNSSGETLVPNVIGMKQDEAKKTIEGKGLKCVIIGKEKSDQPEGTVIRCYPEQETNVKLGYEIRIAVSGGDKSETIPNLKEIALKAAKEIIKNNDLQVGKITELFDDSEAGTIIRQSPDPDTPSEKNTKIDLWVSKGPEVKTVRVPDIKNQTVDVATTMLSNVGLKINVNATQNTSDKNNDGKIFQQSVEPDSDIPELTIVNATVYKYAEGKKITIPKFIDMTVADAKDKANSLGIQINVSGADNDIIISQDVTPGNMVMSTTKITLTSKPAEAVKKTIQVPNFINLSVADAKRMANDLKLNLDINGDDNDMVTIQNIPEGMMVNEGSTIKLTTVKR